ncbi:SLC39A4 protein [Salpingoeca rosetta]|uniref:SLC39A4 protein n=1 Tax=Salpingoeca rosetta (strain ATCC 50818 / BSB-021) TaxID=946362 RepID=F2U232_SALR5|nr:SLC39A4 protein [Salpingoeca rosetta]EGD81684.1 SLC39A4 protein [Salpingoeca rosetta]|eukprot:XP_004996888.1 SLC39A4 protein [Salpingoeca rosetta]
MPLRSKLHARTHACDIAKKPLLVACLLLVSANATHNHTTSNQPSIAHAIYQPHRQQGRLPQTSAPTHYHHQHPLEVNRKKTHVHTNTFTRRTASNTIMTMSSARLLACLLVASLAVAGVHSSEEAAHSAEVIFHYCADNCPSMNETHLADVDLQAIINTIHAVAEDRQDYVLGITDGDHHDDHDHDEEDMPEAFAPACWNGTDIVNVLGVARVTTDAIDRASAYMLLASINSTTNCSSSLTDTFLSYAPPESGTIDEQIRSATTSIYSLLGLEPSKHISKESDGHAHDHAEEEEGDVHDHVDDGHDDHEGEDNHEDDHEDEGTHEEHMEAECVPVDELVMNATAATSTLQERVAFISTHIVAMALGDHCFLPKRHNHTAFVEAVFATFAGTDGLMDADEMLVLYTDLGLTGSASADSHDGHAHARRRRATKTTSSVPCLQPSELAAVFGYNLPVTEDEFATLAVAVVAMVDGEHVLIFMMSMAVASLFSDAILHLIPHSFGLHAHEETGAHAHEEEGDPYEFIWKGCLVLVGFYVFFMLEVAIAKLIGGIAHEHHQGRHHEDSPHGSPEPSQRMSSIGDALTASEETSFNDKSTDAILPMNGHNHSTQASEKPHNTSGHEDHHHHHHHHGTQRSTGWLILLGDAIHNFVDGLALGTAFSASTTVGISTTIAILLHEVPHEIGDFAVLLDSGFSVKRALVYNFFSQMTAILGGVIGTAASATEEVQQWILAAGAGLFLYVALSDITPHVLHYIISAASFKKALLLANGGFAVGFLVIILLARYEEDITL